MLNLYKFPTKKFADLRPEIADFQGWANSGTKLVKKRLELQESNFSDKTVC